MDSRVAETIWITGFHANFPAGNPVLFCGSGGGKLKSFKRIIGGSIGGEGKERGTLGKGFEWFE